MKFLVVVTLPSIYHCVTFLIKKGKLGQDGGCIWILGEIMNTVFAHPGKKFNFVYDRTITMKTGCVDRGDISQGNDNFCQFMSQMCLVRNCFLLNNNVYIY